MSNPSRQMNRKKKRKKKKSLKLELPDWTPFVNADLKPEDVDKLPDGHIPKRVYLNNLYQVAVFEVPAIEGWPDLLHLSIKRVDRSIIRDWRHLQRIKNEILGMEWEAVELFPSNSRMVDAANQFHLWAIADPAYQFPFGFKERRVSEGCGGGVVQRPFHPGEKPEDTVEHTAEAFQEEIKRVKDAQVKAQAEGIANILTLVEKAQDVVSTDMEELGDEKDRKAMEELSKALEPFMKEINKVVPDTVDRPKVEGSGEEDRGTGDSSS